MDKFEAASRIESAITDFELDEHGNSKKNARKEVRQILQEFSGIEVDRGKSLAETIEDISKQGDKRTFHSISIFILRLLSVDGFFPTGPSSGKIDVYAVQIIENTFDELYKTFNISKKEQTYLKIEKLVSIVDYCYEKLSCLTTLSPKIETISETRNTIQKSLADNALKSFLSPYDFIKIKTSIDAILAQVIKLSNTVDFTFERKLKDLSDLIQEEILYCQQQHSFLADKYYQPFLKNVEAATNAIASKSKEDFVCDIYSSRGKTFQLEKRFPLHLAGAIIKVYVTLTNKGPGIAERVYATCDIDSEKAILGNEIVELGSIPPGDFIVPISIEIFEECDELSILVSVSWKIIGATDVMEYDFIATIGAQQKDVDWAHLSSLNPYSLEIATGDNFHGREDFISRLTSRTKHGRMASSYITGQRRVGKSSLAKAVEDNLIEANPCCFVMYIECGDFKGPTSYSTVDVLRENIELFLSGHLPQGLNIDTSNSQTGSLASLTRTLSHLDKAQPEKSFLIIIDEFDEINPDLYRYSEIAETFFLNLRSLSGKRNLGFIFIGAEKMAYVMSSQGEKLNKFSKESLDKFSKENEWGDFEKLVKGNIDEYVRWHESAILSIFNITNGHPFFAKQVCAKVFENIINSKDTEVTNEEVDFAVKGLISELDTNPFQHFWRDGIVDPDEVEITSYKRCQVLAALARTIRSGIETSPENIQKNIYSSKLPASELLPFLSDFCRRNILNERDNNYFVSIPLFERWLVNDGFSKLVAEQLSDELYEQRQFIEDTSYVTDDEISELVSSWPDYRGVRTTTHAVRDWISQVSSHVQQRYLYKLLERLRFYSKYEIRDGMKSLHDRLKSKLPLIVTKSRAQRRKDIWVTYIDGPGKSGNQYANIYADENAISANCIKEIHELDSFCSNGKKIPKNVSSIIIVDDFIGTGNGLSSNLITFFEKNGDFLVASELTVYVVVLCATVEGEEKVRQTLSSLSETSDLLIHEHIDNKHYAFNEKNPIWSEETDRHAAKDLIQRLGLKVDKNRPLGYKDSAMLIVFNGNCPNNTLPILHSKGRGESAWMPLFERVKH